MIKSNLKDLQENSDSLKKRFAVILILVTKQCLNGYNVPMESISPSTSLKKNILFKTSLRRAQFELAMKGNPTMLIWLGKQYLGQNERTEVKFNASEVNAINKDMITNVAKERDLKDFE